MRDDSTGSERSAAITVAALRRAAARGAAGLREQRGLIEALHLAGLWSVAVAQPIFDILGRSPEFFVAHETRPGNLLGLVLVLGAAGPAACLLATRLCHRLGPRWHAFSIATAIGALVAAVALATVTQMTDWGQGPSFTVASVCGALAAGGYVWSSTVRLFTTFLSPAALVVPAVFLLHPTISPFLAPDGGQGPFDGVTFGATPPVVVVVFDQLPLVSLLDRDGRIDRTVYPNFAALASDATWFRNASAVSGLTDTALPAILTGNYPAPELLPTARDHPHNLFTLFGSRYHLNVLEPLTDLCPETLCETDRLAAGAWLVSVLSDLSVVYLRTVLPADLAESLPSVTQNWRDFAAHDTFIDRWNLRRSRDRRTTAVDFIASISADATGARPVLHFMHVLLPHEPWIYLPTGQRFSLHQNITGGLNGTWFDDERAVALNYQRHLLQVQYVDSLLGRLLERLRALDIYDDAVIVVTSDHGASLRASLPFRAPTEATFTDLASVPLLIKRPGQQVGNVVTTNVETIDILPTLAAEVDVGLPWRVDGSNAFTEYDRSRLTKTMFTNGATKRLEGPGDLGDTLAASVARKFDIFPTGNPTDQPRLGIYDELVGTALTDLRTDRPADFTVVVNSEALLGAVEHDSDFVPAHITGGVVGRQDGALVPPLAVAIDGNVAAVTRAYPFRAFGHRVPWEVVVDPRQFAEGANLVEVFAVREDPDGSLVLAQVGATDTAPATGNLAAVEAEVLLGVTSSGFFSTEWTRAGAFRWTTGAARVSAPMDPESPPTSLSLDVLITGGVKQLQIAVNGCTLFDATVWDGWAETFALDVCPLDSSIMEIELLSDVHVPATNDSRSLGIGVGSLTLHGGAWGTR